MRAQIAVAIVAGLLVAGMAAEAHHSFAATYDQRQEITIEGEIAAFMFRNPHSFVHILALDEDGEMQRWGVEWGGASLLAGQGVTRHTLKPGDRVIIKGNPGRNESDHRIRMRSLRRPSDGFGWGFEGESFE